MISEAALPSSLSRAKRVVLGVRGLTLVVALLAVLVVAMREVADPDLWWHMATGRYIVANGSVPTQDVFSFTASTHRWVTHEWLSDVLLYLGHETVGFTGLALCFALVIATAYGVVFLRCLRAKARSRPILAACSVVLAALASGPTYGVRPQMLSLLLASLFLYILDDLGRTGRRVWLLVPLTLLWANLHSGFVAGLAIIGVHAAGEELAWLRGRAGRGSWLAPQAGRLGMVLLACATASLVTPNGISAVAFPFGTLSSRLIQDQIQEWASPNYHKPMAWPLAAYWLALVGVLAASRRTLRATELLLLLGASAAAMYSIRHAQFLSLVGAPILAESLGEVWPCPVSGPSAALRPPTRFLRTGLWVVAACLVLVGVVRARAIPGRTAEVERVLYPSKAVAYMREQGVSERILNTYHWGGYLIWHGYQVFVDGRAEVYGDEVLGAYVRANSVSPEWEECLRRYGVEAVLIEAGSPLAVLLRESGRWQAVFQDELAAVFVGKPDG